jgi:flavodoxin I
MKILVIFDTFFGNTEQVANAIGKAMADDASVVRIVDVKQDQLAGLDYLVVGSPTRAFKATKPIIDFLNTLPAGSLNGVKVAAFDTRMDVKKVNNRFLTFMAGIFGYAAKPIADRLAKKGGSLVSEPEGFIVLDSEGPLMDSELERAEKWAEGLLSA